MMTDIEKSWLAAAIDADGCITVQNVAKGNFYRPLIHLGGVKVEFMEHAKRITGVGTISKAKYNGERHQGIFTWAVSHRCAAQVAIQIIPFLILKRRQAEIILELDAAMCRGKVKRNVELQHALWKECRKLNGEKRPYTGIRAKYCANSPEPINAN